MSNGEKGTVGAPPYGVFATFKNAIEQLAQGVPNQIDRTVFPGMSWNSQTQLLAGLKFFGLIEEGGKPQGSLHALAVTDEAKRKGYLQKLVRERYAPLFALDLMKTTPAELDQRVTETYGITGDTRLKAVRFFLTALAYLQIPVSPLLTRTRGGNSTPGRKRRSSVRPKQPQTQSTAPEVSPLSGPSSPGTTRVVALASGGTLTISASLDLFKLSPKDRNFVFALIDQLEKYESDSSAE